MATDCERQLLSNRFSLVNWLCDCRATVHPTIRFFSTLSTFHFEIYQKDWMIEYISENSSTGNGTLEKSIQLQSLLEAKPIFDIESEGKCPDCSTRLMLGNSFDNKSLWNMTFPRSRLFKPIEYFMRGALNWKIAFEIQRFLDLVSRFVYLENCKLIFHYWLSLPLQGQRDSAGLGISH